MHLQVPAEEGSQPGKTLFPKETPWPQVRLFLGSSGLPPAAAAEGARLPGPTQAAVNELQGLQRIPDLSQGNFPISFQRGSKAWPYQTHFMSFPFAFVSVLILRGGFF